MSSLSSLRFRLSHSSLNNEFFAKACQEWREALCKGELTADTVQRSKVETERERSKLDPWKVKHFEPIWGCRNEYDTSTDLLLVPGFEHLLEKSDTPAPSTSSRSSSTSTKRPSMSSSGDGTSASDFVDEVDTNGNRSPCSSLKKQRLEPVEPDGIKIASEILPTTQVPSQPGMLKQTSNFDLVPLSDLELGDEFESPLSNQALEMPPDDTVGTVIEEPVIEDHILDDDASTPATIIDDNTSVHSSYSIPPFTPETPPASFEMLPVSTAAISCSGGVVIAPLPASSSNGSPGSPFLSLSSRSSTPECSNAESTPSVTLTPIIQDQSPAPLDDGSSTSTSPKLIAPTQRSVSISLGSLSPDSVSKELGLKIPMSEVDPSVLPKSISKMVKTVSNVSTVPGLCYPSSVVFKACFFVSDPPNHDHQQIQAARRRREPGTVLRNLQSRRAKIHGLSDSAKFSCQHCESFSSPDERDEFRAGGRICQCSKRDEKYPTRHPCDSGSSAIGPHVPPVGGELDQ